MSKNIILTNQEIEHKIKRIAYQIYETFVDEDEIVIAGITTNGFVFAKKIAAELEQISTLKIVLCEVFINKQNVNAAITTSLSKEEYENEIQIYIKKLGITDCEIVEKEQGNIPMTSYKFWKHNTKNIVNIGSAGGWTKASTGYTFKNASKKSKALVQFLKSESDFTKFHKRDKFWFYDLLLLDILSSKNELGSKIFSSMFKAGDSSVIFKFLDEETSFSEDLQVIWRCPKMVFVKALFGRIFK